MKLESVLAIATLSVPLACGDGGADEPTGGSGSATASAGDDDDGPTGASDDDDGGPTGADDDDDGPTSADDSTGDDGGPEVTPGGPVLFFSDLANGPRTGNGDTSLGQRAGVDGAIVTVWGKNLGAAQGDSTVTVGGVDARVYAWGPADHGADLWSRMGVQAIALQIPGDAPLGDADLEVVVDGIGSNALPFATRDEGRIFFVGPDGTDGADGSWASPWATFDRVLETIAPGDVVYFLDGFVDASGQFDTGFVGLATSGTPELPQAIAAYPGATVTVGGDACEPTGHALLNNYSYADDTQTSHWVISKLRIESPPDCEQDTAVVVGEGFRLVGNYLSTPRTSDGCQSGAVQCGGLGSCGDDILMLGNELAFAQAENAATGSKQCHGFYISGNRQEDGVESNREIGWNYIHDCANNRAINIYNESFNGAGAARARIEGHRIHDNWVEQQRGIGLLLGADVTGDNWVYNNVFVDTGLGPEFVDGGGFFPFQLQAGSAYDPAPTTLVVTNNLVYGASFPDGPDYARGLVFFASDDTSPTTLELHDNIFVSTEAGIDYVNSGSSPFASSHNLWFGAGDAPSSDEAALADDPGFVDPQNADFHLGESSPARGAGMAVDVGELDFDGIPREADAWSVGPFQ